MGRRRRVVGGRDRRRRQGIGAARPLWGRRWLVAVVWLVLYHVGRRGRVVRFPAVEVPVAAAGCAFERGRVGGGGGGGRHELATPIQRVAPQASRVVLQTFLVRHHHLRRREVVVVVVVVVALQHPVRQRQPLPGLDLRRRLVLRFRTLHSATHGGASRRISNSTYLHNFKTQNPSLGFLHPSKIKIPQHQHKPLNLQK